MRKLKQTTLVLLVLGLGSVAHADLIGVDVTTTLAGSGGASFSNTDTVGAGVEGGIGDNFYDYGAFSFEITTFGEDYCGWITCDVNQTVTLTLSDLDFGAALIGVTWAATIAGVTFDSGADWVSWTWNEQAYGNTTYITARFEVPEPGTLALLGIGLFGMGLAKRRKAA